MADSPCIVRHSQGNGPPTRPKPRGGGFFVLTVEQGVENELAVLLDQVVDVSENTTIAKKQSRVSRSSMANCRPSSSQSRPIGRTKRQRRQTRSGAVNVGMGDLTTWLLLVASTGGID